MIKNAAIVYSRWYGIAPLVLTLTMVTTSPSSATTPQTTQGLDYISDPLLEEIAEPISDAELGGIGCLVASTAISGSMLYLMGGVSTALSSITPPIHPSIVLEGSAAIAFVLSSACYIGVALAPIAVSTYNSISDKFVQELPPRPLFAPGELLAIGRGAMSQPQPATTAVTPQQ